MSAVDTDGSDENSDHAASTISYSVKGSEPLNAHSVGTEDGSPLSHTLTMSDDVISETEEERCSVHAGTMRVKEYSITILVCTCTACGEI